MFKYLVILLSDNSLSYCHYDVPKAEGGLISLDNLRAAILYGMKENLMIQFIYPDADIPQEYASVINSIDSIKYKPLLSAEKGDIGISESWPRDYDNIGTRTVVIRRYIDELLDDTDRILDCVPHFDRINIVIRDVENIRGEIENKYRLWINYLAVAVSELYDMRCMPQINILTDRIFLDSPKHCGAGVESVTVGADGSFYICPAFFYEGAQSSGCLQGNVIIRNRQLLELQNAPICKICDAWHCRRCVWMNKKLTREVNTPGRQQCVTAHIEREGSATLLKSLRSKGLALDKDIRTLDYIDPFDKIKF